MPSWNRFDAQPQEYKDTVIPKNVKARLTIEMKLHLDGINMQVMKAMY